jgi:hypothetical protein
MQPAKLAIENEVNMLEDGEYAIGPGERSSTMNKGLKYDLLKLARVNVRRYWIVKGYLGKSF